jgi:hypothetical protein
VAKETNYKYKMNTSSSKGTTQMETLKVGFISFKVSLLCAQT